MTLLLEIVKCIFCNELILDFFGFLHCATNYLNLLFAREVIEYAYLRSAISKQMDEVVEKGHKILER